MTIARFVLKNQFDFFFVVFFFFNFSFALARLHRCGLHFISCCMLT